MPKPSVLFFADSHLDTNTWANRPNIRGDSLVAFDHIIDKACELEVDAIIGAGDLIDVKKPLPEVAEFIRRRLDQVMDCDITFAYIQGQHEMSRGVPWFSAMHDGAEHIDETLLYLSDARPVYGLDWRPANQLRTAIGEIPDEAEIIVMHQVWLEFMGPHRGAEGTFTQLPDNKVIFTGDFHENRKESLGGRTVISPGSTSLRKISEPPDKYYYILYTDGSWKRHQIPSRRRLDVRIDNDEDLDFFIDGWPTIIGTEQEWAEGLPEEIRRPLIWLKYNPEVDDVLSRVERAINDDAEIFRKELPREELAMTIEREERDKAVAGGLVGCLHLVVDKDEDDYRALESLLGADDIAEAIQELRKRRGLPKV